ncbi:MAG TPA: Rrf2 family transcriptional regulator [Acidimicrobiales bacterium]|nr:Rrf2 family transcriptional regulator [Acidimicrobiales bacterium]
MEIPAKVEYGVRALLTLIELDAPASAETLALSQDLPAKFLGSILNELRRADIVTSHRGFAGGYGLARPAADITLAEVMRVLDGPLAAVRGRRPEDTAYTGAATNLQTVWVALRASIRAVVEHVSLEDVYLGRFPPLVMDLSARPDAWKSHARPAVTPRR